MSISIVVEYILMGWEREAEELKVEELKVDLYGRGNASFWMYGREVCILREASIRFPCLLTSTFLKGSCWSNNGNSFTCLYLNDALSSPEIHASDLWIMVYVSQRIPDAEPKRIE